MIESRDEALAFLESKGLPSGDAADDLPDRWAISIAQAWQAESQAAGAGSGVDMTGRLNESQRKTMAQKFSHGRPDLQALAASTRQALGRAAERQDRRRKR